VTVGAEVLDIPRIPSRESAANKARRLLVEGRVQVVGVEQRGANAIVRGDSGHVHGVAFDGNAWSCSCPSQTASCNHIRALQLVVIVDNAPSEGWGSAR
jgi:hypothetical protein